MFGSSVSTIMTILSPFASIAVTLVPVPPPPISFGNYAYPVSPEPKQVVASQSFNCRLRSWISFKKNLQQKHN